MAKKNNRPKSSNCRISSPKVPIPLLGFQPKKRKAIRWNW